MLVLTIDGNDRTTELVAGSLRVEHRAASFTSVCSFTLYDEDNDITISSEDSITLVDGAIDFFSGRVIDVEYTPFTTAHRNIRVNCQDLNAIVNETVVDQEEVFTAEADADIIDSLFDDYLPAVDSETYVDTIQDPLTITVGPCTLRSALSQICTRTGGYFYVDFDNKLHYFTAEADVSAWWLSDTPDQVDSFSYFDAARKFSNATRRLDGVFVQGAGVEGWRGTHAPGDRQAIVRDNRITTTTGRDERGDAILSKYGDAQIIYKCSTYKAGLTAGMDVRFICTPFDVDDTFTVRKMVVRWDDANVAYYQLELGDPVNPALIGERTFIDAEFENSGDITAPRLPTSSKGWVHNLVFSATDNDTVAWAGAGTITLADGTVYTIDAGNTGNMANITYIFLDLDTSETVLQTTTASNVAVGSKKILICVAQNVADATKDALYKVFQGSGESLSITTGQIVADAVTTNEIAANTIVAGNIAAGAIETDELAALAVTAAKIAANTITADKLSIGEFLYDSADGLLLLGPHCYLSPTEWRSLRMQSATMSGALHQTQGMWLGTRGLVVEEATTNLVPNPSFETDVLLWNDARGATRTQSDTYSVVGDYAQKVVTDGVQSYEGAASDYIATTPGGDYTASMYVRGDGAMNLVIVEYNAASAYIGETGINFTADSRWQRQEVSATLDGTCVKVRVYIRTYNVARVSTFYFDGVQFEARAYASSYADGDQGYGYAWTGAAHASTSTRTVTEINLDAHAGLIANNNTLSIRVVGQAPYDADATWPAVNSVFMDASDAANDRIYIYFDSSDDKIKVLLKEGAVAFLLESSAQTFVAYDWLDTVITLDYSSNEFKLYVNGVLEDTDTTACAAPTPTQWNLGSNYLGANQAGLGICELAVFGAILTPAQVSQLFELQQALVDTGSMETPGIYILDGRFRIASGATGNRIEITADEVVGYDDTGTKQFYLQASDGVAYAGGGAVYLNELGVNIEMDESAGIVQFLKSGTQRGVIYGDTSGATPQVYVIAGDAPAANSALLFLYASSPASSKTGLRIASSGAEAPTIALRIDGTSHIILDTDWLEFQTSYISGLKPDADEAGYVGSATVGWYEMNSKQYNDIGCLPLCETVALNDGRPEYKDSARKVGERVTNLAAIRQLRVMPGGEMALCGEPRIDYSTLPAIVYNPAFDPETGEFVKDRAELTALIGVILGAIRELDGKVEALAG